MAVCTHPPDGAHGGLYPRRPGPTTLAVAPEGGPPHPGGPDLAPHLDEPDPQSLRASRPRQGHGTPTPTTPEAAGAHQPFTKLARATHPPWLPHAVHSGAPSGRLPTRGPTKAVSTPQERRPDNGLCGRRSHNGRPGDRREHGAKAEQCPQQRSGKSSMVTQATAMVDLAGSSAGKCTPGLNPSEGPKGPQRRGRNYPPFSHQPSAQAWQRSGGTLKRLRSLRPARQPPPAVHGQATLHRGRKTPRGRHTGTWG